MQPLGRKPIRQNLIDHHPGKGYVNWWENEECSGNKKQYRQLSKKEIRQEIKAMEL